MSGNKARALENGFDDKNTTHKVLLNDYFWKSKFFAHLNSYVSKKTLEETFNNERSYYFHSEGFTPTHFNSYAKLKDEMHILATSKNAKGQEFVAMVEHKKYPIYMTQFHPEKTQFEKRSAYKNLDRSPGTIQTMSSFAFKLTELARPRSAIYQNIPEFIQKNFPYYNHAINSPVQSFERIYIFQNYFNVTSDVNHTQKRARMMRMLSTYKKTANSIKKDANLIKTAKKLKKRRLM